MQVKKMQERPWAGTLLVAILFLTSFLARLPDLRDGVGAENLEASYHVLLTIESIKQSPASEHLFLPIISLGQPQDKGIPWGATVPTKHKDYIYTSFLPAGFLAPYAALSAFDAQFTLRNLAIFNGLLGLIGIIFFFQLAWRVAETLSPDRKQNVRDALLASLPILFSAQGLQSTGLIYWHQCIYQIILLATCHVLLSILKNAPNAQRSAVILLGLAFIGPFFDWTALLVNGALVVLLCICAITGHRRYALAGGVVAATLLSILLTISHFALLIGAQEFLDASLHRFGARSVTRDVHLLPWGYVKSFGLFLIVFVWALLPAFKRLARPGNDAGARAVIGLAVVVAAACLENLVLFQHASQFGFDRFKFAVAIGLLIVTALPRLDPRSRGWMEGTLVASSVFGVLTYVAELRYYGAWQQTYHNNLTLRDNIDRLVDRKCALFVSNSTVRAYTNIWLKRGVFEDVSSQEFAKMSSNANRCGAVYLISERFKPDIFSYPAAVVRTRDGNILIVKP